MARGNGLLTRYAYDPVSFRLRRLRTEGYAASGGETLTPLAGTVRQDTGYGYDLAGNITATVERAPQSGVSGAAELERLFAYDALYRLVAATGRENQPTAATPWQDQTRSDGVASTTAYKQLYQYDLLGNLQQLAHRTDNSATYFTRQFTYSAATNRLQSVAVGGQQLAYAYDASGNVVQEQQSRHLQWDAADQLRQFATWTGAGSAPTLLAYYVYDAGGQRTKKLTQTGPGTWQVTIYVDGSFEHRYEVSNGAPGDEQTMVYVLDGQSRLYQRRAGAALGDQRPAELYPLEDHLGSAAATVDTGGGLVSREEYYPFGETSFGSHAKQRYRFCGKERDQESGLYYYGLRYYAPWLCRFVSSDPLADKYAFYTPYQYAGNQPTVFIDLDGAEKSKPKQHGNHQAAVRLIFFGGTREIDGDGKKIPAGINDNNTFGKAAQRVRETYLATSNDKVTTYKLKTGEQLVSEIEKQQNSSVKSLDVISYGGPFAINTAGKQLHRNAGLYDDLFGKFLTVFHHRNIIFGDHWNGIHPDDYQFDEQSRPISDINFDKFATDAVIELHGCLAGRSAYLIDNIAEDLSQQLFKAGKTGAVVIAHATKSNPNIDSKNSSTHDYRQGGRIVYYNGAVLFTTTQKGPITSKQIKAEIAKKTNVSSGPK